MTLTVQTEPALAAPAGDAPQTDDATAPRRPSLSPSRAADFKTCPLLYRFRTIDRLPERKSLAAVRGTLVHSVLERLYDLPAAQRTVEAAQELAGAGLGRAARGARRRRAVRGRPGRRRGDHPLGAGVGRGVAALGRQAGGEVLHARGPDPHPAARPRGTGRGHPARRPAAARLRRPAGRRPERRAAGRRLQDRRGAARGVRGQGPVPDEVLRAGPLAHPRRRRRAAKLLYLKDGDALTYAPDEAELIRFERTLVAIWAAIERAVATGDFRPNKTRLCDWCDHQAFCPALGGTPPPFPVEAAAAAGWQTLPIVAID